MAKVYLGGSYDGSNWRKELISQLKIDHYNPTSEIDENIILEQKNKCDFYLYVVTPKMLGFSPISEVSDDSNKRPAKTLFCFLEKDGDNEFTKFQIKSLSAVGKLVKNNGGMWMGTMLEVIAFLNGKA